MQIIFLSRSSGFLQERTVLRFCRTCTWRRSRLRSPIGWVCKAGPNGHRWNCLLEWTWDAGKSLRSRGSSHGPGLYFGRCVLSRFVHQVRTNMNPAVWFGNPYVTFLAGLHRARVQLLYVATCCLAFGRLGGRTFSSPWNYVHYATRAGKMFEDF